MNTSDVGLFFGGWLIIFFSLWAMSKFEGTKTALYYLLWTGVVLDIVTHGQEIQTMFEKFNIIPNSGPTNEGQLQPTTVNGQTMF